MQTRWLLIIPLLTLLGGCVLTKVVTVPMRIGGLGCSHCGKSR